MHKAFLLLIFGLTFFLGYDTIIAASISGQVLDQISGESIAGASVYLKTAGDTTNNIITGRSTNSYGLYSLSDIEPGKYDLYVRSIGYSTKKTPLTVADSSLKVNVMLSPSDMLAQEVTVVGDRNEAQTIENISVVDIEPSFIKRMPAIGGEIDLFRTLQLLPGISSANELSSGLYVRGGSPDQNLILLDGVIVYNPTHLGGFFSTFNTDALKDIRMIKGAFPAEYGGRVSSVLDVTMKEGAKDGLHGSGGISLIASRLTLEGPITEDISFMISGRRSYLDLFLSGFAPEDEEVPSYYIYDLNAKTNWRIDENNHLYLSGYFGGDVFSFDSDDANGEEIGIDWGNSTANLRWMHIVSPEMFTNFSLIYTDFSFNTNFTDNNAGGADVSFGTLSRIRDFMIRGNADYFPHQDHHIKFGIESILHQFTINAGQTSGVIDDEFEDGLGLFQEGDETAVETAVYFQDEWQITPRLASNLGVRLYYFDRGNYVFPEPRMSFAYDLYDDIQLKAAATMGHQFLHLVVRNDVPLPTDLWFPSTEDILPQRAYQGVLGAEKTFLGGEYLVSVEGFYKYMENLLEFREDVEFTFGLPQSGDFARGTGQAYGLEFFLNKRLGDFTGWLGYTLSWSTRQFDEINRGDPFFVRYDRRHDVSLTLNYSFSENWEIGAVWVYATGQAFTMPQGQFQLPRDLGNSNSWSTDQQDFTERNGYRLPAYHRLDLNFMWKHKIFNDGDGWLSINLYNVYNRLNPFAQFVDTDYSYDPQTGTSSDRRVIRQLTLFPFIPTLAYNFEF
jgi:hypothetical protein